MMEPTKQCEFQPTFCQIFMQQLIQRFQIDNFSINKDQVQNVFWSNHVNLTS
jgi:hypothetical protein